MKYPCFITKTGIAIGCLYTPPPAYVMSREDLFWQKRFLKYGKSTLSPGITREQIDDVVASVCLLAGVFSAMYIWLT